MHLDRAAIIFISVCLISKGDWPVNAATSSLERTCSEFKLGNRSLIISPSVCEYIRLRPLEHLRTFIFCKWRIVEKFQFVHSMVDSEYVGTVNRQMQSERDALLTTQIFLRFLFLPQNRARHYRVIVVPYYEGPNLYNLH